MKQSWSHRLFLKINSFIGTNIVRDRVMYFCAKWLIFVIIGVVGCYILWQWQRGDIQWTHEYILLFLSAVIFAESFAYLFALIFHHPRPIVEFPEITQLVHPFETWKSFPSDHTIISFCLVGTLFVAGGTSMVFFGMLYILAFAVACGRVYAGVHYPRDIVGGFLIAHVAVLLAPFLLHRIVEPLYYLLLT